MHGYINRLAEKSVEKALGRSPVVAILGSRQSGKSTLAKHVLSSRDGVYLDLQDRADLAKLTEPELFFEGHRERLVCLDEIQRIPDFFNYLRSEVDRKRDPGRFLLLGAASRDLIRQSSETLAGRIAFIHLSPFTLSEVEEVATWQKIWLRGGFPDSVLAKDEEDSYAWRQDFIRTFLERDIPALGFSIPVPTMERLWRLLAHYHGQTINFSKLAVSADLSVQTLKKYLHLLEQSFMIRLLQPAEVNLKKRLVKSPKIYIRDSGILHALLGIEGYDDLLAHPIAGASWEGAGIEQLCTYHPESKASFIRTSNGAEMDLMLERGGKRILYEFKLSKAPKPARGFNELRKDIQPDAAYVVAPVEEPFALYKDVEVISMKKLGLEN